MTVAIGGQTDKPSAYTSSISPTLSGAMQNNEGGAYSRGNHLNIVPTLQLVRRSTESLEYRLLGGKSPAQEPYRVLPLAGKAPLPLREAVLEEGVIGLQHAFGELLIVNNIDANPCNHSQAPRGFTRREDRRRIQPPHRGFCTS